MHDDPWWGGVIFAAMLVLLALALFIAYVPTK